MKTYTLKQWFPGLPVDWEIGMELGQGDKGVFSDYYPCDARYANFSVKKETVENNPTFFIKGDWLLVTEDGKAIYDKQTVFWRVDSSLNMWSDVWVGGCESHTCFSTEDAAKKYIRENKTYKLPQIIDAVNRWAMIPLADHVIEDYLK